MDENQIGTSIMDCAAIAAHKKQLQTYSKLTGGEAGISTELRRSPDEGRNHENHQWTTLSKNLGVSVPPERQSPSNQSLHQTISRCGCPNAFALSHEECWLDKRFRIRKIEGYL